MEINAKEIYGKCKKIYNQHAKLKLKCNKVRDNNEKREGYLVQMRKKEEKRKKTEEERKNGSRCKRY